MTSDDYIMTLNNFFSKATNKMQKVDSKIIEEDTKPGFDRRSANYYLGDWERSQPKIHLKAATDDLDEPHVKRKHAILAAHPQVVDLYGIEPSTKYITIAVVATQLLLAYLFGHYIQSNIALFVVSYVVGGTCTQLIGTIIHEAAHSLMHESLLVNRCFAFIANIGIVFPIAASFRRYHLSHHAHQGVVGMDADLPMEWEVKLIKVFPINSGKQILEILFRLLLSVNVRFTWSSVAKDSFFVGSFELCLECCLRYRHHQCLRISRIPLSLFEFMVGLWSSSRCCAFHSRTLYLR